jgi:hypothetical protein
VTATGQLDPTQVYTTGNVVQQTTQGGPTPWVNGVYQDNLTCWAWGDPGYCGPNAIVRPGGSINFSFGQTDLYQSQAIASILPNTGTGLRVNGYNFGFTAKNGNGWDDGRTDSLYAYVHLKDSGGKLLEYDTYNLNYQFNWTNFNYSKTFTTPYSAPTLGNVTYGFVGRDNNGWAGPYGPEIYNVSFSLKYSVDPCSVDVLSSPSCPGYLDALAKLVPPTPTASITYEPTTATITPTVTTAPSVSAPATTTTEVVATTPVATTSTSSGPTTGAGTPTSSVASVSATPSATNPQPKVGEVQTSSAPKSTVSTSQILSIVSGEQSRIGNIEKTVVQEAVQQAISAGASATAQAESIAASAQAQSIASSNAQQSSASTQGGVDQRTTQSQSFAISPVRENNPTSLASLNAARDQSLSASNQGSVDSSNSFNGIQIGLVSNSYFQNASRMQETSTVASIVAPVTYSLVSPRQIQTTIDELKSEGIKFGERNIIDMATQKSQIEDTSSRQQTGPSVKKNVKDNDAAGGVTIASIAKQPQGFESYMGALADAQFYAPKEIYRNQRVIDNARVLRGLTGGSDRLHQQMIDQQYNLGR